MMPLALKTGLDAVIGATNYPKAFACFLAYGAANLISTYFDGRKSIENAKVVQTAWYKISLKAYNKLLELDW